MPARAAAVEVRPLAHADLDAALPLFAGYQRFYRAEPDDARNRAFLERLVEPSDLGVLLGAWQGSALSGIAGLYWTLSTVSAGDVVLMNDLYVDERFRGGGVARALIEAAAEVARARGAPTLRWFTEIDNRRAQALYERFEATRTAYFEYELRVAPDG